MATRGKKEKEYPPMPANWMYKRGDVYMMDLNPYSGSEQGGIRPAIVVQNDDGNFYSNVLLVVPLTTQIKKRNMPTHFISIMVQSLKFSLAQSNPLPTPAQSIQMRQQLLPNCWLTPLWLHSLKILQKTYKSLYISSGSFRIWKSAAICFRMIPFPCVFSP